MWHWLLRKMVGKFVVLSVRRRLRAFEDATTQPREVQEGLLRRFLAGHAGTAFGKDHHFASVASVADFRRNCPVAPYEYFEPYIQRVMKGESSALLADPRVHMFALTSGTTAP